MKSSRCKATTTQAEEVVKPSPLPVIPVTKVINDGIRLAQEKLQNLNSNVKPIKPAYENKSTNQDPCTPFNVYKIEYPKEETFGGCHHVGNKIPCRVGINRVQHTKLLATPNPVCIVYLTKKYCY